MKKKLCMMHACDSAYMCVGVATCGGQMRRRGVFIALCLVPLRQGFSLNRKLALLASWLARELLVPTYLHLSMLGLQKCVSWDAGDLNLSPHPFRDHSPQPRVIFSLMEKALVQLEITTTAHYFIPRL